jgi:Bacterial Ig domain
MKLTKTLASVITGISLFASSAMAGTVYSPRHGALVGGEANIVSNGGAKIFFPAAVSGTLIASPIGAIVKEDIVTNGSASAGLQVRSTLTTSPRSGMSSVYVDAQNNAYLMAYQTYLADGAFNTSVNDKPTLLDPVKYPGISAASNLYAVYGTGSLASTFYLSGTKLYQTSALKPGTANSATAVLIDGNALNVVGTDTGVFVRNASGVTFYSAGGNSYGLSSIISPSVSAAEFNSITAVHDGYFLMIDAAGNQVLFSSDGLYSNTISLTNRVGFVSYLNRSAQVNGHNGQTAFAWYTADYKLSYIDPYSPAASAIKSIDWSGQGGTKQTRANTVKVLGVSEDGFVSYTGKSSSGTTVYLTIGANASVMTNASSTSSSTLTDATTATAASVAWNNPTNADWHYKVAPIAWGNGGTRNYYYKWAKSTTTGKITLSRTTSTNAVKSYTGGGRVCRLASTYYLAQNSSTVNGSGTAATTITGPANTCSSSTFTVSNADATDLLNGSVPVGSLDLSYIDASGNFVRTGSYSDLTDIGTPTTVSGALASPTNITGSTGWDGVNAVMFGLDSTGAPFTSGEIFSKSVGASMGIRYPFAKTFQGSASSLSASNSVSVNWNDPRDTRGGVTTWNVTSSRLVGATAYNTATVAGSVGTRSIPINPATDGYTQNYTASATLVIPDIGHRGASFTLNSAQFTGSIDRAPTLTITGITQVPSNSAGTAIPATISDMDAGDVMTLSITSQAVHGVGSVSNGQFIYTPNLNYIGTDSFSVQVADAGGLTSVGVVNVNVVCTVPTINGLTLAQSSNGPFRGTTANLSYSSNSCNGGLPTSFVVKDANGNTVAGTSQSVVMTDGQNMTKGFIFDNVAPGVYSVTATVTSTNLPAFTQDLVASTSYTSAPTTPATISSNKVNPTEDDDITVGITGSPLCTFYDSVSGARLNKGCVVEWSQSAGVYSVTPTTPTTVKVVSARGAQTVSAVVRAYNTDGTSVAQDPVTLNLSIAPAIDILIDKAFSKVGSYNRLTERVGINVSGNASNLCQVVPNDTQAQAVLNAGSHACVLEFTSLPDGVTQTPGTLVLNGRIKSLSSTTVAYNVFRFYAAGVRAQVNSGSFDVPAIDVPYTATLATSSYGAGGLGVEMQVTNGATSCVQTTLASEAKASWIGVGEPKCLVEWSNVPSGLLATTINGNLGFGGLPAVAGDQSISYTVSVVDELDAKYVIGSGTSVILDQAPVLTAPSTTVVIDTDSALAEIPGISQTDPDVGQISTLVISSPASHGLAVVDAGMVKYKPSTGFVGNDSFGVKAKDAFGSFNASTVNIEVGCNMPSVGSITTPNIGGFWEVKPVNFNATFSPRHDCHAGFQTSFELVDKITGAVAFKIDSPSAQVSGFNSLGISEAQLAYNNVSFTAGNYKSRLRIRSNAYPTNEVILNGDDFIVTNVPSPTLSSSKANPTEDELVTISAAHAGCGVFSATASEAIANQTCYLDWTKSGTASSITQNTAASVDVAAVRGVASIRATVKIPDGTGVLKSVSFADIDVTFQTGSTNPVLTPSFSQSNYVAIVDTVVGGLQVKPGGYECQLASTLAEGISLSAGGNKVCMITYTKLPNGIHATMSGARFEGRIINAADKTIEYSAARVYADGSTAPLVGGSFLVPTTTMTLKAYMQTDRVAYAAAIQNALVYVKIDTVSANTVSCQQTSSESEAMDSWANSGTPKCMVSWQVIPSGMGVDPLNNTTLIGKPLSVTGNAVAYKVEFVDTFGTHYEAASGTGDLVVRPPISPTYVLDSPNGEFIPADGSEPYTLVGADGILGTVTLNGGDFAPMHIAISDVVGAVGSNSQYSDLAIGQKTTVSVSPDAANAWSGRNASMSLSYEGLGDLLVNNVNLRIMRLPSKMSVIATPPNSVIDTANFSLAVKVGEFDIRNSLIYKRDVHGLWKAYVAIRNVAGTLVPITQELDVSANDGSVTFDGLSAAAMEGKTVVVVAIPNLSASGTLSGVGASFKVVSAPVNVNYLPGGPIPATLSTTKSAGPIPLAVHFDVGMDISYRNDVASITYEYQLNGGQWTTMPALKGASVNYIFQDGGNYSVRAIVTNKNTMAVSQTSPVDILVKQALKLTVTNNLLTLPGVPVDMTLTATKPDGTVVPYVTEWQLLRTGVSPEIIAGQDKITISSDVAQTVNLVVRARPTALPADDPESWVSTQRTVMFAIPAKPRVGMGGPASIEAGVAGTFSPAILPAWPSGMSTKLAILGKWTLPDGTEVPGTDKLVWTPDPTTVPLTGLAVYLKFTAWVEGAEVETSSSYEKKIFVTKYEFPHFKLTAKADTTYAPAYISVLAVPETLGDMRMMSGKKFTYTWTIPDGIIGRVTGNRFAGTIDMPGSYAVSVNVADDRGNSTSFDYPIDIIQSRPYTLNINPVLAQKFNRNPANFAMKVELAGGHPKDRIKSFKTYIDDVLVSDSGARAPLIITVPTSGTHTLKVTIESNFGMYLEASKDVTVGVNVAPTCTATQAWDLRGKYVLLRSVCKDEDGVIRRYAWYVDDVLQVGKTTTYFVWVVPPGSSGAAVKLVGTDDSGATSEFISNIVVP